MREADLLAAIRAAPDDDGPRLVLADLLQDRGDPRGELIAVQCALARLAANAPERAELAKRESELMRLYRAGWLAQLGLETKEAEWRRGFVEVVHVTPRRLAELSAASLVREIHLVGKLEPRDAVDVAGAPQLAGITKLVFANRAGPGIGDRGVAEIAVAASCAHLRGLGFRNNGVTSNGAKALARAVYLDALTELDLDGNAIDVAGIRALAESGLRLTALRLYRCKVGVAGADAIAESTNLRGLHVLNLYATQIRAQGASAIARALPSLAWLDVGKVTIGDAITDIVKLPALARLEAYKCGIADDGAIAIASSPAMSKLTHLALANNALTDAGARALASSPYLNNLAQLSLFGHRFGDAARAALVERFPGIVQL